VTIKIDADFNGILHVRLLARYEAALLAYIWILWL